MVDLVSFADKVLQKKSRAEANSKAKSAIIILNAVIRRHIMREHAGLLISTSST